MLYCITDIDIVGYCKETKKKESKKERKKKETRTISDNKNILIIDCLTCMHAFL